MEFKFGPIYATNKSEVPLDRHFAIVLFREMHIPGDERSQTNPGHGYPAHKKAYCEYLVFQNEEHVKQWILQNENASFAVLDVKTLRAQKTISMAFELAGLAQG